MSWTKAKLPVLDAAKWLALVLVLVFLYMISVQGRESQTAFSDMSAKVTASADLSSMQLADNQMVKRLYGLDPGDYDGVLLYYPTTNMGAEEILLVKLKSTDQQDTVTSAIDTRISTQKSSFDGYGVDQYAMLENAVVEVQGNYILLVVASDPAPVRKSFLDAL